MFVQLPRLTALSVQGLPEIEMGGFSMSISALIVGAKGGLKGGLGSVVTKLNSDMEPLKEEDIT